MIVDSSALVAVLREEEDAARIIDAMTYHNGVLAMSAASYLETAIVIDANDDPALSKRLDALLVLIGIEIVPVSVEQARRARVAYRTFGKGRHRARLNFGDCFSYALAIERGEPLLFKGDDFIHTDVRSALPSG